MWAVWGNLAAHVLSKVAQALNRLRKKCAEARSEALTDV
jgi:hypothetical protein